MSQHTLLYPPLPSPLLFHTRLRRAEIRELLRAIFWMHAVGEGPMQKTMEAWLSASALLS
ncbi:MAG: hypothetical protein BRD48_06375 [Bacteroidetes bacterium QS_9_68_14]|nr:MAG: hypothetical protein BRD48_06375 [Bacteroidetes bacterium QS_9_68_14]